MGSISTFKKEILLCTAIMAGVIEIISLFFIGFSVLFISGLAVGTAVTILNFLILVKTGILLTESGQSLPVVGGYVFRLLIYGAAFLVCIKLGLKCGAGCGAGFICLHLSIFFLYAFVYRFIRKTKNPLNDWTEPKQWNDLSQYDEEDDW